MAKVRMNITFDTSIKEQADTVILLNNVKHKKAACISLLMQNLTPLLRGKELNNVTMEDVKNLCNINSHTFISQLESSSYKSTYNKLVLDLLQIYKEKHPTSSNIALLEHVNGIYAETTDISIEKYCELIKLIMTTLDTELTTTTIQPPISSVCNTQETIDNTTSQSFMPLDNVNVESETINVLSEVPEDEDEIDEPSIELNPQLMSNLNAFFAN